jgi:hypothetical protein
VTPRRKPTTAASHARPSSKQDLLSENRPTERGRCHAVVTIRSGFGESTGDAKIRFLLVRLRPELLRDNGIRPMSDWGSSGRKFKSRPAQRNTLRPEMTRSSSTLRLRVTSFGTAVEVCPSVAMVCRKALPTDSACENFLLLLSRSTGGGMSTCGSSKAATYSRC